MCLIYRIFSKTKFSFARLKSFFFVVQVLWRREGPGGHAPPLVLCQERFPGNSLLCNSQRHPKLFWFRHSQNLVGGSVLKTLAVSLVLEFDRNYRR